jgi:hypothetical protein
MYIYMCVCVCVSVCVVREVVIIRVLCVCVCVCLCVCLVLPRDPFSSTVAVLTSLSFFWCMFMYTLWNPVTRSNLLSCSEHCLLNDRVT